MEPRPNFYNEYKHTPQSETPSSLYLGPNAIPVQQPPVLLNDDAVKQFLINGYCCIDAGLDMSFHHYVVDHANSVFVYEENSGNNLLCRMPELNNVCVVYVDFVVVEDV